jgi:formate hydrogenlyase subunit 3/multisubunit Na+/H+ antiporter MnhD subunit
MTRDWFAVVAGPVAWFIAHVASWMLVPGAHDAGSLTGIYLVDLAALAIAGIAAALAAGRLRMLRGAPEDDRRAQRARFLATSGLALSALSIVLVVGLTLPLVLLVPGAEP